MPGVTGDDKDLLAFTPTSLGIATSGTWSMYFDGTNVGLNTKSEDINALCVSEQSTGYPALYLSTRGTFSVTGLSGSNEDVFEFVPTTVGYGTTGQYGPSLTWDMSEYGLASFDLDGISFGNGTGHGAISNPTSSAPASAAPAGAQVAFGRTGCPSREHLAQHFEASIRIHEFFDCTDG